MSSCFVSFLFRSSLGSYPTDVTIKAHALIEHMTNAFWNKSGNFERPNLPTSFRAASPSPPLLSKNAIILYWFVLDMSIVFLYRLCLKWAFVLHFKYLVNQISRCGRVTAEFYFDQSPSIYQVWKLKIQFIGQEGSVKCGISFDNLDTYSMFPMEQENLN